MNLRSRIAIASLPSTPFQTQCLKHFFPHTYTCTTFLLQTIKVQGELENNLWVKILHLLRCPLIKFSVIIVRIFSIHISSRDKYRETLLVYLKYGGCIVQIESEVCKVTLD